MPRRFSFRLQPILKLRAALEKDAQRHLGRMVDLQRNEEAHLEALVRERETVVDSRRAQPGAVLDLPAWRAAERYLVVLDRRLVAAEAALQQAVKRVQEARQALLLAHREHLMLVRLRERKWAQHQVDLIRDEAKEADDLTVLRYRRTTKNPLAAS
jgi:flagellar export protein FliJ